MTVDATAAAPETWVCAVCGDPSTSTLSPTVSDRYQAGHCRKCRSWRQFRRADGADLKRLGIAAVNAAPDENEWRVQAELVIRALAAERVQFTSTDVTDRVGLPARRNAVGGTLNAMARAGVIRKVGYRPGERSSQHARIIAVWEGS